MRMPVFVAAVLAVLILSCLPAGGADLCEDLLRREWVVMDELDRLWDERDFEGLVAYTGSLLAEGLSTPLLQDRGVRYRARALKRMGSYRESIEAYDELVRINPRAQRPYAVNMETYLLIGDYEGARQYYSRTQEKVTDPDVQSAMRGMFLLVAPYALHPPDLATAVSPWSESFKRFWRWHWLDKKYAGDPLYERIKVTLMGDYQ